MKLAIDSYCYHRYFGEWYDGLQHDVGVRWTIDDFLRRADSLGVTGVSLEACFFPDIDDRFLGELRDGLDNRRIERVWAWGHPNGLASGSDPGAADDLRRHLGFARSAGASVMRICAGGRRTRPASWTEHKAALLPLLRDVADDAQAHGVILAIENHIDLFADELVELVTAVDSPYLGVCLDTANNLRMLEDPMAVIAKLAPYARATHIKDVAAHRGDPKTFAFWPSVPLGHGIIDVPAALQLLRDAGYGGLLAIEIDYLHPAYGDEDQAVAQSVDYLRKLLAGEAIATA